MSESDAMPQIVTSTGPRKSPTEVAEAYRRSKYRRTYYSGLFSLISGVVLLIAVGGGTAFMLMIGRVWPWAIVAGVVCSISAIGGGAQQMANARALKNREP